MLNEKEKSSSKVAPEVDSFFTTEEKAQYEIFRNGELSRETIGKWVRNDLTSIGSFIHGTLNDATIFNALVDAYYFRYQKLHGKEVKDES